MRIVQRKGFVYLTFILLFVFLISCKNQGKKTRGDSLSGQPAVNAEVSGALLLEGDDVLLPLMNDLASDFRRSYPNIEVNVSSSNSESAFKALDESEADVVFVSTPAKRIPGSKYNAFPFVRDALVMILNFDNIHLQTLVIQGISRETLAGMLTMNITEWSKVNKKIEGNDPLKMYLPPKSSGTIEYLADFAGLSREKIKADDAITERDVPVNVANLQIAVGICSHTIAYDHATGLRRGGLYIVGIDVNNNGILDNEELIYDDLQELLTAVRRNNAPPELIREFSLCFRNDSQTRDLAELFIRHVTDYGKLYIEKHKLLPVVTKTEPNN